MAKTALSKLSDVLRGASSIDRLDEVIPGLVYVFDLVERQNVYANRSLASLLGYTQEAVARLGEQLPATLMHPDDLRRIEDHRARMVEVADGQVVEIEYRVRDAGGTWRWLHSWETVLERNERALPLRILGIAQDVSRRARVEEELRDSREKFAQSEQRWRSIAENPFDFVVVIDRQYRFAFVNFLAPGLTREDLIGKRTPLDFATEAHQRVMREAFEFAFREGRPTSYEVYVEPLSKWYHSIVGPIREGDQVTQLSILTRDITSEKAAQEQARQTEQRLRQMELKLAQAGKLEALGQLAGGIAHDFNNLLTGIGGVVELLAARLARDEPSLLDIDDLRQAVKRGAGLTRQLLAFSRQESIAPTVLSLNALIENSSRLLGRLIGEDIELSVVPASEELCVRADAGQLEQVLLNLAVNARDAMPFGGRLSISSSRARIDARAPHENPDARVGEYARLTVADTGSGIDDAVLPRIFEPFFTTKPIGSGTGLGLSMVYGIVSKAGGFVHVSSRRGEGATFEVWLPLVHERAAPTDPTARPRPSGSETVLLVEDDEMVSRFTANLLRRLGYTVIAMARGDDALARIESGERFDLLLTDVLLPGLDGYELFRRAVALRGEFPVVFMSGYADNILAQKGVRDAGAAFLQKPFSHDDLAEKVRATLDGALRTLRH